MMTAASSKLKYVFIKSILKITIKHHDCRSYKLFDLEYDIRSKRDGSGLRVDPSIYPYSRIATRCNFWVKPIVLCKCQHILSGNKYSKFSNGYFLIDGFRQCIS